MFTFDHSLAPIYVVGDDPDDLVLTRRLLARGLRNRVVTHRFSSAALLRLRGLAADRNETHVDFPAAVIVDGNMPELDGVSLLRALRSTPAYASMTIVMLSGSTWPDDPARALREGANRYPQKYPAADVLVEAGAGQRATNR